MDFSEEGLKRHLFRYKFRDLTIEELQNVHRKYPALAPSMDTYTFSDGSQKDLVNLSGTIPVKYQGQSYNTPVCLWILDSHPFAPPLCFLKPTSNMVIRVGKHVDGQGRIYLPYLKDWSHPKSSVIGLINEMIGKFEEEPPLCLRSSTDGSNPVELMAFMAKVSGGISDMSLKSQTKAGRDNRDGVTSKVTVVGGGDLGLACVMAISAKDVADKLVFIDVSESATKGGTMDLDIFSLPKVEVSKDFSASAGSKVVVVTANSWSNDRSYLGVLQSNVDLYKRIIPQLAHYSPNCVLLIASQPVDVMTYIVWKLSKFPPSHVIGTGCNLDSERFQYITGNHQKPQSVDTHAWIIGEHGENKVATWSELDIAVNRSPDMVANQNPQMQLADRAFEFVKVKGQRSWSVGLSVSDLTESIVRNKRKRHSVSTLVKGWYGINNDVFLSLPCVLGNTGVMDITTISLQDEKVQKLRNSAVSLHNLLQQLQF
ncbi:ubiquitin-conjugating enzyme E2 variant 3 isoform X2 [Latimeria chalumnae]|uniref:UEV and lactate/malate dehyrogenase domains n=1 Tax=Latimeria chalumnae TaxID=7897 RepID=H3AN81_LATCH|nr:PREDICTED: ubiquitin-conjugating enzyme E2 variant 3 isoform X1 [Latimeria chalumnae]|eukprot:XP_005990544.1 PREDICTED: ubiquitin-conjugating enzyme E2 variant 3 isoform X1 [Latimeria chalumnae]